MESKRRDTKQKRIISAIIEGAGRPLSPAEVHVQANAAMPQVSISTVYRALRALQEERRIIAVSLPGAPDRYEAKQCAERHHHHFHCDGCGRVFDIPGCGLRVDRTLPDGFSLVRHEVVLYGTCSDCGVERT